MADGDAATTTTDAGKNGGGGTTTDTGKDGAGKTFTQDDVNRIVAREKGQVESQFADYNDLKTKAEQFDELENSKKTETERLTGDRDKHKARADTAEAKLARYEAAAKAGLPLEHAGRIQGSTPEEMEADAKTLAESLGGNGGRTTFDGGARGSGDAPKDMNALIRRGAGRPV